MSLSAASLPVFTQTLGAMAIWLEKAEAFCAAKKIDPSVLAAMRLAPDMLPLSRQILIACDFAKNTPARLSGIEPPKFEDSEKTLAELKERIARTLAYIGTLPHAAIDGGSSRDVVFPMGPDRKGSMKGSNYLTHYALPNFYFHSSVAYAILRHNGIELGKRDFMGAVPGLTVA